MTPPAVHADLWPLAVLCISMALVIVLITMLRVHAFLALITSGIVTGLLARTGSLPGEPAVSHWVQAVELTVSEFGVVCGKIGIVIVLAALIGVCLLESGAADRIVRRFLALFGEAHAGPALLVSGYIVSIPIFYDSFILLLMPLARRLRIDPLWITCDPENLASRRSLELAGAEFVEVVSVPEDCVIYQSGHRRKCRYRLAVGAGS